MNRSPRGRSRTAAAALALAGVAPACLMTACHSNSVGVDSDAPYVASESRVDLKKGSASWNYISLATAATGEPIAPEPVPGRVAFDESRSVPVIAPIPGRVDSVAVRLGQHVAPGDRLVAVRSTELVDLIREIEVLRSKETARKRTVERLHALVDLKASPEKDLIEAQQSLEQTVVARQGAEMKLQALSVSGEQQGLYWLTAKTPGVVVDRNVLVGQETGPDRAEPLLVLANLDEVIVTADVPENDVPSLQVGQPAEITSPTSQGGGTTGHVEYISEVVDPVRRMVNVRVRVPNTALALRPNAFVQVAFPAVGAPRVVAPAEAVVTDVDKSYVFVQAASNPDRLERREVTLGRRRGGQVEIANGLAPGEKFVTKGAILLLNSIDLVS